MNRVRVIRSSPIDAFADLIYHYRDQAYRVWIISPWIRAARDSRVDPLALIAQTLRAQPRCVANIITRRPTLVWHADAIQLLKSHVQATVFYADDLHTKLFILEAHGFWVALLGSPNFTPSGNVTNQELALEMRSTTLDSSDDISSTVRDLMTYAADLRADERVKLAE